MTNIEFKKDDVNRTVSFTANGHADTDEYGKDLVCAAISILTNTLAQNVIFMHENNIINDPSIKLEEGNAEVICTAKTDDDYRMLLQTYLIIQVGFMLLVHNFPDAVCLIQLGEDINVLSS